LPDIAGVTHRNICIQVNRLVSIYLCKTRATSEPVNEFSWQMVNWRGFHIAKPMTNRSAWRLQPVSYIAVIAYQAGHRSVTPDIPRNNSIWHFTCRDHAPATCRPLSGELSASALKNQYANYGCGKGWGPTKQKGSVPLAIMTFRQNQ